MVFLDGARFIEDAITSIVAQTGIESWELVLVDDGSTDGSSSTARRQAAADRERIRYVDHPGHTNLGMSASRNLGVRVARGDIIGFLDSDDILLPNTMERAVSVLQGHPGAEAVIGRTVMWFSWGGQLEHAGRDRLLGHPSDLTVGEVIEPPALFGAMYGTPGAWMVPAICGVVVRRDALLRIGGSDERFRSMFEDQVLYAKLGLGVRVVLDDHPYALYRQHAHSACAVDGRTDHWNPWRSNPSQERFLRWLAAYVRVVTGTSSPEAAIVEANMGRRETVASGTVRLVWTMRRVIMERAPVSAKAYVRRVRRDGRQRPEMLSDDHRAVVAAWSERRRSHHDRP